MSTSSEGDATFFKTLKSTSVGHLALQSMSYRVGTPCISMYNYTSCNNTWTCLMFFVLNRFLDIRRTNVLDPCSNWLENVHVEPHDVLCNLWPRTHELEDIYRDLVYSVNIPQCARTVLNKRFLPKPMTTTGWKGTPYGVKIMMN